MSNNVAEIYNLPLTADAIKRIVASGGALVIAHGMSSIVAYPAPFHYAPHLPAVVENLPSTADAQINIKSALEMLLKSPVSVGAAAGLLSAIGDMTNLITSASSSATLQKELETQCKYHPLGRTLVGISVVEAMQSVLADRWDDKMDVLATAVFAWRNLVLKNASIGFMSTKPPGVMTEDVRDFLIKEHYKAVLSLVEHSAYPYDKDAPDAPRTTQAVRHFVVRSLADAGILHLLSDIHIQRACLLSMMASKATATLPDAPITADAVISPTASAGVFEIKQFAASPRFLVAMVDHMLRQIIELDPLVLASAEPPAASSWPLLQLPLNSSLATGRVAYPSVAESDAFKEFNRAAALALKAFHFQDSGSGGNDADRCFVYTGELHVSSPKWLLERSSPAEIPTMKSADAPFGGQWYSAVVNLSAEHMQIIGAGPGYSATLSPGRVYVYKRGARADALRFSFAPGTPYVCMLVNMVVSDPGNKVPDADVAEKQTASRTRSGLDSGYTYLGKDEPRQTPGRELYPDMQKLIRSNQSELSCIISNAVLLQRRDIIRKFYSAVLVTWTGKDDIQIKVEDDSGASPSSSDRRRMLLSAPNSGYVSLRIYPKQLPSIQEYTTLLPDGFRIPRAGIN